MDTVQKVNYCTHNVKFYENILRFITLVPI
jgi:hypothetical protein